MNERSKPTLCPTTRRWGNFSKAEEGFEVSAAEGVEGSAAEGVAVEGAVRHSIGMRSGSVGC